MMWDYRSFIRVYTGENMKNSVIFHLTTGVIAHNSLYKMIITVLIENYKSQIIIINEPHKSQSIKMIRVV